MLCTEYPYPPKIHMLKPNHQCDSEGMRSWDLLERELSHEGGILMNEISVPIKRPQKVPSSLLHVSNSKQMAICEPGSKTSEDTGLAGTFILDFL